MTPWRTRRARAVQLMGGQAHAEEILGFYVGVLEAQQVVSDWLDGAPPLRASGIEAPSARGESGSPGTDRPSRRGGPAVLSHAVESLAPGALAERYRAFIVELTPLCPDPLAAAGADVRGHHDDALVGLLREAALERGRAGDDNRAFFAEAFLQPIAVRARGAARSAPPGPEAPHWRRGCPTCGFPPVVAVLRDDPDRKGHRSLECGRCGAAWAAPRVGCAACGEISADALMHHVGDAMPHMRVDECQSCRRYIKTVDLRQAGDAVPVVEDIGSPELDLWAGQRGYEKVRLNLMGL